VCRFGGLRKKETFGLCQRKTIRRKVGGTSGGVGKRERREKGERKIGWTLGNIRGQGETINKGGKRGDNKASENVMEILRKKEY